GVDIDIEILSRKVLDTQLAVVVRSTDLTGEIAVDQFNELVDGLGGLQVAFLGFTDVDTIGAEEGHSVVARNSEGLGFSGLGHELHLASVVELDFDAVDALVL